MSIATEPHLLFHAICDRCQREFDGYDEAGPWYFDEDALITSLDAMDWY